MPIHPFALAARPDAGGARGDVAVVIPARNEAHRIGATVRAARCIDGVDLVVVADDGSTDRTRDVASHEGAVVVSHYRPQGKAAAMVLGASAVAAVDAREGGAPRHLLFLDADLGDTAGAAAPLVGPVRDRHADMTIAVLPQQATAGGGHGFVVRLSRRGVMRLAGFEPTQPLSGQRCLTRAAFDAARPLARGFGVETGLTIDLVRKGLRVVEVPVPLRHRVTGRDLRAQWHRAVQYAHVARALVVRYLPLT
ncbi:MAG TPA: glycosyltransferase [Pilimelia sp.]|nr:glycosyltransferase [Pilimelia sp.]